MVLYQFDFTVVAFPFEFSFLSMDLFCLWTFFWIDSSGTLQEGEMDGKTNQLID